MEDEDEVSIPNLQFQSFWFLWNFQT